MATIPRFTEAERKRVTALLLECNGKLVPVRLADSSLLTRQT